MLEALLLAIFLGAAKPELPAPPVEPERLTAHLGEDYMPAVSRDGALLAFVSNRSGQPNIWIKTLRSAEVPSPRRLTNQPSGDKNPVFSPDGKTLVYVSYGSDAEGDLYRIQIPKLSELASYNPSPEKLTDITTADKEPVFTPGGDTVIFSSYDKKGSAENLWSLNLKTLQRKQITKNGGSSAAVSPDGETVVFVSRQGNESGGLSRVNPLTGEESAITGGEYKDLFPAFIDNRRIVFIRYADDTTGEGNITFDDRPSLYTMDITKPGAPPVPLTTAENYNLFPAVHGDHVYYSFKQGANVDVARIPVAGILPPSGDIGKDMERARNVETFYPDRKPLTLLAWRVAWAANFGEKNRAEQAECLLKIVRLEADTESPSIAGGTLAKLQRSYHDVTPWAGLAKIEDVIIQSRLDKNISPIDSIARLHDIEKEYAAVPRVKAAARMETARYLIADRKQDDAVNVLRSVIADFQDLRDVTAEAAYRRNEIYKTLDEPEKLTAVYLDVIRNWSDQPEWVEKSVNAILDLAVVKDDIHASTANLNAVIEKYDDLPELQAWAMNRIARLYHDKGETGAARDTYRQTVSRFPNQRKAANEARFSVAAIYAEEENFAEALEMYRSIEQDTETKKEAYLRSRSEYIRQSLRKADYEFGKGDVRVALKTYLDVAEYEPSTTEAHRGLIRCRVALGETAKAVAEYSAKTPDDKGVYAYALALAMTYLPNPPLDKAEELIKLAVAKDDRNPWFHQTLGWVFEQREPTRNDGFYAEQALQEYGFALVLTDRDKYPERVADLMLNLGNSNYLLRNYGEARDLFRDRAKSPQKFENPGVESLFRQRWGECEYRLGDDTEAAKHFTKAIELLGDNDGTRRIEIYERLGLAMQSAGKNEEAARYFVESLKLRKSLGVKDNETVILRNIANNLFLLSQSKGGQDQKALRKALAFYKESEASLSGFKKADKTGGKGLINVEIETGAGGVKTSSRGFSENDEKKLIYHHLGRIYGELGDYKKAVEYFEKKLGLTPSALPLLDNVPVLTEKAIVLNQLAYYLAQLGDNEKAVARFGESLDLCMQLASATGLLINADNMARIVLANGDTLPTAVTDHVMERGLAALNAAVNQQNAPGTELSARALNHMAQLHHAAFSGWMNAQPNPDPVEYAKAARKAARDANTATDLYTKSIDRFNLVKTADGLRGAVDGMIGLAWLKTERGDIADAITLLTDAEKSAQATGADDALWKVMVTRYLIGGENYRNDIAGAARALERLPLGYGVGENPQTQFAMIRALYGELAEARMRENDIAGAVTTIDKGRVMAMRLSLAELASGDLKTGSPTLTYITSGDFDPGVFIKSLAADEAAITVFNDKAIIATANGFTVEDESAMTNAPALASTTRLYLVTELPLSDPMAKKLDGRFAVATVPSFGAIEMYKRARNINDFTLFAPGYDAVKGFITVTDQDGALPDAGVLLTTETPVLRETSPLQLRLTTPRDDAPPITLKRIAQSGINGSILITPPPKLRNPRDAESGLVMSALLAGYPSWVILPDGADVESLLRNIGLRAQSIGDVVAKSDAILAGTFGFGPEERVTFARGHFMAEIKAGADALARNDLKKASGNLQLALHYTAAAGISQYDELIFDKLSDIETKRKNFAAALDYQTKLNDLLRRGNDPMKLAAALLTTGVIQTRMGKYADAVDSMNAAISIYRENGMMEKLASTSSKLGVVEEKFARYGRALEAYGTALFVARGMGDSVNSAQELRRVGRIYHLRLNNFDNARAAYGEALRLLNGAGDTAKAVAVMIDLAAVEEDAGALDEAERILTDALAKAEASRDEGTLSLIEFHMANVNWFRGDYDPAFRWIRKSIKRAEKTKDDGQTVMSLNTLGLIYWTINDNDKALSSLEKSHDLAMAKGMKLDAASALNNIGLVHRKAGDIPKSLEYFRNARAIDDELKSQWGVAYDARNMGISLLLMGKAAEAEKAAEEAVELTEKIGDKINGAKSLVALADARMAKGDWQTAMDTYKKAQTVSEETGVKETLWRAMLGQGRILKTLGDPDAAITVYEKAVDVIEKMRAGLKIDELKSGFFDDKQDVYEELILLLLDKGRTEDAFAYAERSRSRGFLDLLGATRISLNDAEAQAQYDRVMDIKRRLDQASVTASTDDAAEVMAKKRLMLAEEFTQAVEKLRSDHPEVLPLVTVEPVNSGRILDLVGDDAAIVEYVVTANETVAFVLNGGRIKATRTPVKRTELEKLVMNYRKVIQDGAPVGDTPKELYKILYAPVKYLADGDRPLGIVPHGVLHYLSFASLHDGDDYLVAKKSIFYLPSSSVFERTVMRRATTPASKMTALAVGDPDLGSLNTELPLAELEAKSMRWVFPKTEVLTRKDATKSRVIHDAEDYNIIHIASHGQFDPANPLLSSIYLAPNGKNDGQLRTKEVFSMDLDADLITLSACQTGLGQVSRGDEVVGLARAFLYSGAHSIVSTLWRVDDMASAVLVKHFYRNLLNQPKALALRQAQMLIKRRYPHPSYWAGFTLVGDYR